MIGVVSLTTFTATIDGNSVEAKTINARTNYVEKNKSIESQAIHDAVYRGMRAAGSSNYYATKVAHGIKQDVGWLL